MTTKLRSIFVIRWALLMGLFIAGSIGVGHAQVVNIDPSGGVIDRNGNGIIEESDYWTTSDNFSKEEIEAYNSKLKKRAIQYNKNNGFKGQKGIQNRMAIGSCNLISCGSFLYEDVTFTADWGGEKVGVDGSVYGANVAYDCWNDVGTVDYSEGQYISYSTSNANIETPGLIQQSTLDGGGFAIFSFQNEAISQNISVVPNTVYEVCFEIAVIPRYRSISSNNNSGTVEEFAPNLNFGISSGGIVISDPLTYTHNDLNIHPLSDFPFRLSNATSGNNGDQHPDGYTLIDPYWENVCITFLTNNSGTATVFYQTGNPGRSVVLVDGLRLSLEGYANAPELSTDNASFCINSPVDLNDYVLPQTIPTGAELIWSTNSNPTVIGDHLANTTVTPPGTWYAFFYNATSNCFSPVATLVLSSSDLDSSFTKENVTCSGDNDGSINLTITGGVPPYAYSWTTNNGSGLNATSQDQNGLTAGTYNVLVTDDNGCTTSESVTIDQPTDLEAAITASSDADCFGSSTGSATVTASGGTPAYSYSWNTVPVQTTATATGLAAGSYTVTVTDANGCTEQAVATIGQATDLEAAITASSDADCFGSSTGSATVTASGGTPAYSYSWNTVPVQTTATATGLAAGSYTVTVTDANGCTEQAVATIGQATDLEAAITASSDADCFGSSTGSATVTASGGTPAYSYSWNTVPVQTTATATGLAAGSYTVTVTDANGCTEQAVATIGQATDLEAAITASSDADCFGSSTGSATVTASGGTPAYSYSWNTVPVQTTATATGLAAGSYTVTVTDANGCTEQAVATIGQATDLEAAITASSDADCFGSSTGSATVTASGGTPAYSYSWNTVPVQTTATATGLAAGSYTVTVTDANGCTEQAVATIGQATDLEAAITASSDADCFGSSTGSATVTASGGTPAYSYSWNTVPVQTTATATGLAAGSYTVTVTDANGCTEQAVATIGQATDLEAAITASSDADCFGSSTGSATVTASGGTPAYSYSWNTVPVQTTATATGLAAGSYTVTVTDANGCTEQAVATIDQATDLEAAITASSDADCFGSSTGSATVTASGGTPAYSYSWNTVPVQTTATATGLAAGSYTVTVTDANGCTEQAVATIGQATDLEAAITASSDADCFGSSTGSATVTASGGTPAYSYSWNTVPVQTTATATGLAAGSYTVTVTDANGCTEQAVATIDQATDLEAAITASSDADCFGSSTGSATVTASGGTPAYSYSWNTVPVQTTATATGLAAGSYTVTVTDANGCTEQAVATIGQATDLEAAITASSDADCFGSSTGSATVTASGGTPAYSYSWNTVPVQTTATATGLAAGSYTVTVTDANGCTEQAVATIGQATDLEAAITASSDADCFGSSTGSATVTASGGTPAYSYSWNTVPVQTTATATGLAAGSYTVTVTDANGCTEQAVATIGQATDLEAAITASSDADCFGSSTGSATVTASGGTPAYSYSWNTVPVQTTATATGLAAGSYTVTVTDANGCTEQAVATIGQATDLEAAITASSDADCFGSSTGSATVTASGGTPAYSYSWNTVPVQTTATATGLAAGSYTVTVTDANGCTEQAVATIGQATDLEAAITASSDADCFGSSTGSATVTASGGTPAYSYSWNTVPVQTTATATGLAAGSYTVTVTDANGCTEQAVATIGQATDLVLVMSSDDASCNSGSDGTATASVSGGTPAYSYSWNTVPVQTTATATGLVAGSYTVTVTDANGCTISDSVMVDEPSEVEPPISTGDITECEEDPIQTLDANAAITPTPGQTVVWYNSAISVTPIVGLPTLSTVGTITYWAEALRDQTNCVSFTRTAVTLTINAAAIAPISTGDITECEEDPLQTLDANDAITPTQGQTVVWYDAATLGNIVQSPTLNIVGSVTYWAEGVTDQLDCSSLMRTSVTLTINPAADAPISTGDITECEEDPLQTLDANDAITPTQGQTVVWYDAATLGNIVQSPTLNIVGSVTYWAEGVTDQLDCSSLMRTSVTLTINPAADAPISTGDITECEEDPLQTLDANDAITPTQGQTVVWYDAATLGNIVQSPTLNIVGSVTYWAEGVTDQLDCSSLMRTSVTLTINPAADAPISTGDITECEEDPLQTLNANDAITATPGQSVVWYDAATAGNVVANPILNAVGTVTYWAEGVTDQIGCSSLTRTAVTLTIDPAADAPISTGDITECEEDPLQTLDANDAITATPGQSVVWYDAATAGNVVANPILNAVGTVTYWAEGVTDQIGCSSLTRTAVTLTIDPAADAPISTGDITECEEDPLQTLDANDAITATPGQSVVWYDAATAGNVVANPILNAVGTVTYWAEGVTDQIGCSSLTRTAVTLTIDTAADAPISTGDITECEEDPLQTLDANDAITATPGQSVVWYDAATAGNVVANPILNAVGTVTYWAEGVTDQIGCSSLTRTAVTLTIDPAADAPISTGDITECEEDPLQTLDANDAITATPGQSVVWYDAATAGNVVANPILNAVGTVTYWAEGVTDQIGCSSLTRTAVTLTIDTAADAPISTGDITECEEDPLQTLDANDAITATPGQSVVWYDAATAGNVVANPILNAVGTVTYWAEGVTDQIGCSSLTRTAVTLTIDTAADAPISTGDITECEEDPLQTLDANDAITATPGQTVVWYDAATAGNVVANPTLNIVGTVTYWAEGETTGGICSSLTRTAVTLTINSCTIAITKEGIVNDENQSGCSEPGETISYTFKVVNQGTDALSAIVVDDPLLGGLISGPDSGDTNTDGLLDANEMWVYSASYVFTQDDINAGEVINQATAFGEAPDGTQVSDLSHPTSFSDDLPTITTLCQMPMISLEKTGEWNDENGDGATQVGETISYSFKVTNTGSVTIFNITIDDPLPGLTIEGGPIAELAPGDFDDTTFTASYVITEADLEAGEVVNQATATGTDANGVIVNDTSDDPLNTADVDDNGDGEPDDPTVVILPQVLPTEFGIFNGVTPNNDGINDFFTIIGIENFPNNNLKIFNRWGVKVYDVDGYGQGEKVFSGVSDGRATISKDEQLPTGTYFYILIRVDPVSGELLEDTGYLYLNNNR
ncbi:DUF7507 domain-containing protein [Rasiella sp. SM2506]|uniref:Ig-like domain-containing protein n=1 Tax=Rasiella sp. SM2506 TaxID=3423914 RepID=UPI003D7AC848